METQCTAWQIQLIKLYYLTFLAVQWLGLCLPVERGDEGCGFDPQSGN